MTPTRPTTRSRRPSSRSPARGRQARGDRVARRLLYRVALRVALKAWRTRRDQGLDGLAPAAPGSETGPAERAELRQAIDAEIVRLPARYRAAVVLFHIEGVDAPSAARRLRIPLGTLQSRLHRARLQLRRGLTRRGFAPAALTCALAAAEAPARAEVPASLTHSIARLAALGGPTPARVEYLILGFSWRTVMKTKAAWIAGLSVGIAGLGCGVGLALRAAAAGDKTPTAAIAKPAGQRAREQIRAILNEHVRFVRKQYATDIVRYAGERDEAQAAVRHDPDEDRRNLP